MKPPVVLNNSAVWYCEKNCAWFADAWATAWGSDEMYVVREWCLSYEDAVAALPRARELLTRFFRRNGQAR